MSNYSSIITVMLKAARKASRNLLRDFGELEQLQSSKKSMTNFVTMSAEKTESNLIAELKFARPAYGLVSQNKQSILGEDINHRWIINPLDGAENFLHALPYFTVTIALERKISTDKTEIVASVIDAPILGETYWAEKGKGAWSEKHGDTRQLNNRLRVSGRNLAADCLISYGQNMPMLDDISSRLLGCNSISIATVAAGKYDAFIDRYNYLDTAAPMLLVKEAGGYVSESESFNLLCNHAAHKEFLSLIEQNLIGS